MKQKLFILSIFCIILLISSIVGSHQVYNQDRAANNLSATTYGSDESVSDAKLLYVGDVTGLIQAQLDARALESVVGTSLQVNHLVNTAGVLNLTAEVALHDEANTWTAIQSLPLSRLVAKTAEPTDEAVFDIIRADCDTWDPLARGGTTDYFVICTAAGSPGTYVGFIDATGKLITSYDELTTLLAADLDDTSDPHALIQREMCDKIISNASAAMHLDVLTEAAGWSVIFHVGAANNYVVHPTDSADWYLNGTVLAADRTISNTAPTIGEDLACYSTGAKVFCKSTFPDWVSAAE